MINIQKIFEEVDNLEEKRIMEIMQQLIEINTSVPPGNSYREYVDTLYPYFNELDFSLEEVVIPEVLIQQIPYPLEGPRINLVAKKDYNQENWITFYGHMDVVPALPNNWRFPPFEATLTKSGKIYGRGTADMKGDMVCLLLAMQIINKLKLKPKYNIQILNCTDEEVGVYPGIRYLTEQGFLKGSIFCLDGIITPLIPVGIAGDLNITIEIIGKSCHSGYNFLGINAIEEAIPILNELMILKEKVENRRSVDIPGNPRDEIGANLRPMFSLVIIESGEKENIVPGHCKLVVNRRIIPDEKFEEVKHEILESINKGKHKSKALDVKVSFKYDNPPLKVNPNLPTIKRWKKVMALVNDISEDNIQIIGTASSTDMGFVVENLNTEDFIFAGVESPSSKAHGENEFVRIRDIKLLLKEIIIFLCVDI